MRNLVILNSSGVSGNWSDPDTWTGGPPAYPDATVGAAVNTPSTVTVDGAHAALSLDVSNGGAIDVATGNSLAIVGQTVVGAGSNITIQNGGTFSTEGGAISLLKINGGTATVGTGLGLNVTTYDVQSAAGTTLVKTGVGELNLGSVANALADTAITIDAGTVRTSGATPLGAAGGAITLNGGAFAVNHTAEVTVSNSIAITANGGGLEATTAKVNFGAISIPNAATLTTSGAGETSVSSTTLSGSTATIAASNVHNVGSYDDGGLAKSLTIVGGSSGRVVMDNSSSGISAASTTLRVESGTLEGIGANPLGGGAVTLAGGTLKLSLGGSTGLAPPSGTVAFYNFNDGTITDHSTNGYHGSLVGGATVSGGALSLNGSGAYAQLPSMSSAFSNSASLSVWVKLDQATPSGGGQTGFMHFDSGSNSHYPWTSGTLYASLFRNGGRFDNIALSPTVNRADWHLVTYVSDPAEGYKIYQNDQLIFSTTQPSFSIANWRIGTQNGAYLDGQVDDFMLLNRALTSTEIAELYSLGVGGLGETINISGDLNMSSVNITVESNSKLNAASDGQANLGSLNMTGGVLTAEGSPGGIYFTNTTVAAGATAGIHGKVDVGLGTFTLNTGATLVTSGDTSQITASSTALGDGSTLTVGNGGAALANITMSNLATINNAGSVTAGSVTMPSGSTLVKTGAGQFDLDSVTTTGNATIDASGGATTVADLTLAGNSTFIKAGSGKLTVAQGGLSIDSTNTVQVNGGELYTHAASNPLAGAALNLNGGTFTVEGAPAIGHVNGLVAQVFDQAFNPATQLSFHNPASLLNQAGAATRIDTGLGNSNGPGINYNGNFHVLFPPSIPGGTDTFMVTWDGYFNPTTTGTYNINSYWSDDAYSVYVDLNQNGVFEANEKRNEVGKGGGAQGAFSLTGGQTYRVAFGFAENGGGENVGYQFSTPTAGMINVNPAAQPGLWTHLGDVAGAIDMTDSPISVTDNSTLNAVTAMTAAFGQLSYDVNGKTLTTTGAPGGMSFTGTSFNAAVTSAGIKTETNTTLGSINDSGTTSLTLTKSGTANLTLNQVPASLAATTTLEVREGRMNVDYSVVNPTGSAKFLLSGGTLAAQGAGLNLTTLTVDNAFSANGLVAQVFDQAYNPATQLSFHNPASLLNQIGAATRIDTGLGNSNGPGINYNGNFQVLFPPSIPGGTDTFMVTWDGYFNPTTTGTYNINSYWSDDAYSVYVDLNQNGVFEANEKRNEGGTGGGGQGAFNLTGGQQYRVAFGFAENTGGENVGYQFSTPTAGMINVNPAAQPGLWTHLATSTLELNDTGASNLQEMVLKNGNLRITGGSLLTVEQASIATDATSMVGLITETNTILTSVAGLDGNNKTVTFTKSGTADLILNKAGTELGNATLSLKQGRLIGVAGAGANPFGAAALSLTAGELVLASDATAMRTYDNALVIKGSSTLTAGAGGQGLIGATITLGSAGQGVAIESGTLTARTQDDYDLHIAGPITGAGALTVASELTTLGTVNVGTLNIHAQLNAAKSIAATGTLDINAALNRTGVGSDGNVSAGALLLRTGTLDMAAGQTLAVSGSAQVQSGATLSINGAMTGAGGLTVASGGTLTGAGNIANAVTIQNGAILAPGNSGPGTLATGNFTINSGGIFDWGLGATGDRVAVNGNLTLDSGWTFRLNDNSTPLTLGDQLLFTYTGTRSIGTVNFDTSLVDAMSNWHTDAIEIFDNGSGSVYLRNLVVTGPAAGNLTWDGATAEWSAGAGTDSHWNGGTADQIPSLTYTATVNSGKATVGAANAAAHTLTLGGGEVEIAAGRTLSVTDNVNVNGGALNVQGNLAVNVNVDVAPAGNLTVAGNVQALQLNSTGTTTFEAGATSSLPKLNVTGGVTTVNSSTLTTPEVNVSGGNLAVNADMPVERLNVTAAGTVTTSATSDVVVSEKMKLNSTEYSINSGNTFKAGGAITSTAAGRLTLTGGTLTVGDPFSLPSGLEAHYDASTLSLSNGAAVTTWADLSGNGRDLVTYEGTPNFKTNVINGLPAVNFRNESLQNAVASPFFARDVYLVFRSDNEGNPGNFGPDWGAPIGVKDGDDNNRTWMLQPNSTRFWNDELPSAVTRNGNVISSADGFNMGAGVNQFMVLKVTAGPNNGTQNREYIVGSRTDAWSNSYFDTAEILAFNRTLTPAEENALGGYLASKYGLATAYTGNLLSSLNLTTTQVNVEQSTTLNLQATSAAFGGLTLAGGTLTTQGASQGMSFTDTTIAAPAVGIHTLTNTSSGPIDGGNLGATITKTGAANLIVQGAGTNLAGATFDVQQGALIGVHGSNPFGSATLKLNGGEVVLSSAAGSVTYDNAVTVTANSKLTVGAAGGLGQSGPLDVTLGNAATGIALNSGKLTVETTDNHRLVVPGPIAGAGDIDIVGGSVKANQGISAGAVSVANTTLETAGHITAATGDVKLSGGTLKTTGTVNVSATAGNVKVSGNTNLNISSGHLTITASGGGDLPTGLQAWFDASQGVTLNGSNHVTSWTDLSGNAHHATLQNGTPALSANLLNGLPVVEFRGNDDYLNVAGTLFSKEQYVVARSPNANWSEHGAFLGRKSGRESNYLTQHGQTGFHSNQYPVAVARNGVDVNPQGPLAPITEWMLLKIEVNNNNPSLAPYWLGRGDYSGVEFDLAEIIAFNRVLTADEENSVGGYLADKYGISTSYTGGFGTSFGALNMAAASSLTLVGDGGPGTGEATFASISAGHNATINGSVIVKGNVEVGNSVGTLNVNGNYTVASGSTYKWETGAGSSDLIAATGTVDASANWNLEVKPLGHNAQMNGAVLISGGAPAAVPGTVTVTMADNVYSDLFNVSGASAVNSGNNVVLSGVVTASHTVSHGGAWSDNNAWTEGTGNVPTAGDVAVVAGGTVAASSGGNANNLTLAGGNLSVTSGTLAVNNNIRVGSGSELTVDGSGTQVTFGNEAKVYDGGTLHLKDGGSTNLNKTIDVMAGGTLKTSGTQTLQENVEFDSAANLHVASGTLSVVGGGGMPTGNLLWLDASDIQGNGTATTNAVPVTTWTDKSGAGNNATNGGNPATIVFGNGTSAVRLDGDDWFRTTMSIDASVRPDVTIFAVYDYRQQSGEDSLWGQEDGGWDRFTLLNHGVGAGVSHGNGMFNVSEMGQTGIGFVVNEIQMDEGVANGSHVRINGNAPSNGGIFTINGSAGGPANSFGIGAQNANGGWQTIMDLSEFLVFDRILTLEERNNVGGYLADKYGLTTGYTGGFGVKLGNVHVAAGATLLNTGSSVLEIEELSGSGTVDSNVLVGSLLSPGNSIGTLDIDGNLTMDAGTVYDWEMDSATVGDYDSVAVAGTLEFSGDWILNLLDDGFNEEIFAGDKFYLFTGIDFTSGDLGSWSIDGSLVGSGWDFASATIGGDANGVYLTGLIVAANNEGPVAIPEPSTFGLAGLGLLVGLALVVRRRRQRA